MTERKIRLGRRPVLLIIALQGLCAVFFVGNDLVARLGGTIRPNYPILYNLIDIAAGLGLGLGIIVGAVILFRSLREQRRAEEELHRARADFGIHLSERFARWGLTPAEADVAIFAIKGLRLQEIAELRRTSEGTVKAQTNAIYRKAGVNGRSQLLSLFIEDMMVDAPVPAQAAAPLRQVA